MSLFTIPTQELDRPELVIPSVDLVFPLRGQQLPADHNYALLGAVTNVVPEIKTNSDIGLLTAAGLGDRQGKITLNINAHFRIRTPVTKIPLVYPLAGKHLTLGIHKVQLGIPTVHPLKPASHVRSRIVVIKGYQEPASFVAAIQKQLAALGIKGEVSIPDHRGNPARKTLKIKKFTIVGFTVDIQHLSKDDSIKLQTLGLGGKRHMGCGIFLPVKGAL